MTHFVETWGYWAVALLVLAESLGVPLPGETAVIIAGTYAGHSDRLSPWLIFVVAAASAIVGGSIGYLLGRLGGHRFVRRYGHMVRLDERKMRISRYLFDTYGTKVVFFGRFVSVLRTYAAFLAGTSRMSWPRFAAANTAGGIVWAGTFTLLAYLAGSTLRRVSGTIGLLLVVVAAVVVVAAIIVLRRRAAEIAVRAQAQYPDPVE